MYYSCTWRIKFYYFHFLTFFHPVFILSIVSAIRGACPAGGCILSLNCDYRVMTNNVQGAHIGLNEVALGIAVSLFRGKKTEQVVKT